MQLNVICPAVPDANRPGRPINYLLPGFEPMDPVEVVGVNGLAATK